MTGLTLHHHPLRDALDKELQQRLFPALNAPCRLCQFMLTVSDASKEAEFLFMQQLARQQGSRLLETDNDINLSLFGGHLRWERHGEFSSYVFIQNGESAHWFDDPLDFLPSRDWLNKIPGRIFRIVQLSVVTPEQIKNKQVIAGLFNPDTCVNSMLADNKARIWTDFQKHAEGAGRMLLIDHGLTANGLGRIVQQLFDLGNYRKLSLLGWPLSRQALSRLTLLEQQLSDITQRIQEELSDDEKLLYEISKLAAQTEHLIAETSSRLQATAAYYQLTLDRLKSLNEVPIEGMMSLQDFTERRLKPAFRTSESVGFRQSALSNRLGRSTELLRTRISLKLERQNQRLLASMDQRAKVQLKMQQVVESFSLVAISYYGVQLTDKGISALAYWLPDINTKLWHSISVPVVIALVVCLLLWLRRKLHPKP
ncbi:DUF3422 family protein [Neptunicella sp. SCSIO 80796]|uniref:DUF3422 family protein n=1 Tax=Neptunicella plasticusilytica TaxID=3117012 RepID=UPI003A4E5857